MDMLHASPFGRELLNTSSLLQETIRLFADAVEPEKVRFPGRFIAWGNYGFTWLVDGVIIKITSPTSSTSVAKAKDRGVVPPAVPAENLERQFTFMNLLGEHLVAQTPSIIVPTQHFVVRSGAGAYLLGQEFMEDWLPLGEWLYTVFPTPVTPAIEEKAIALWRTYKQRIADAVAGFELRHLLDDLYLEQDKFHTGNILLPPGSGPDPGIRLCIIDQPGHELRKELKKVIDSQ